MKRIFSILFAVFTIFSLSACSGGIKGDEAKEHINGFFDAIEARDYETAATYLHPERPTDLKTFFEGLENKNNLDFSNIEIEKYTNFSFSYYDSTVDGSTYSLTMDTLASDTKIEIKIEIVKNDNGFGIYNFKINV